uniref:Picornavirus capsid domain-containing protein n=1 Tax=Picornavirales sp. TaxID=1955153 RepID=A0A514D638_9VIRU|nr:MAG: hypothetical protein H2BulkLitter1237_000001 [Picornavirales sp.]
MRNRFYRHTPGVGRNAFKHKFSGIYASSPSTRTVPTGICHLRQINFSYTKYNQRFILCLSVRLGPVPTMNDSGNQLQIIEPSGAFEAVVQTRSEPALTTYFQDDTPGEVAQIPVPTDVSSDLLSTVDVSGSKNIIDFLKKPTRLDSGSFTTTDSGKLSVRDPWQYLTVTSVKSYKLIGTYMLRADMIIVLNVNAVRFQTGRYILAWCPSGGVEAGDEGYKAMYRMHTANLMTITQLPHVELDLAKQTHVELRIPFTSIYTHHVINQTVSAYQGMGYVFIYPYAALQAGSGDNTANWTMWARMDNITLSGAAMNQMAPSVARQEQIAAGVGPVSTVLTKIGKAASVMGEIPLLSSAMSTVSWTSSVLARAANVFGFSKPIALAAPDRIVRTSVPFIAVADQVSTAQPLSLVSTNELKVHSGVGRTNQDEMAIDFIKTKYCYFATLTWSASDITDTVLASYDHDPSQYLSTYGKGFVFSPISLLAYRFRQWRGSLRYRIKFVKNEFYSGRLMITYTPQSYTVATFYSASASEYAWREIVDVRDVSEFDFCVPYVSSNLYTPLNQRSGKVTIAVLDPLVCPNTVPSNVPIIVEVAGGEDLEFAVPAAGDLQPYVPATVQCDWPGGIARLQSGYTEFPCYYFGEAKTKNSIDPAATAVGEKAESIRQLMKRFTWNKVYSTFTPGAAFRTLYVTPFLITPLVQITNNTTTLVYSTFYADPITLWSTMYTFSSGSVRLIVNGTNTYNKDIWYVGIDERTTAVYDLAEWSATAPSYTNVHHLADLAIDGMIDVQVPGYNKYIARANASQIVSTQYAIAQRTPTNTITVSIGNSAPGDSNIRPLYPHRMAGEDFSLSGWLGTVPMVWSGTT